MADRGALRPPLQRRLLLLTLAAAIAAENATHKPASNGPGRTIARLIHSHPPAALAHAKNATLHPAAPRPAAPRPTSASSVTAGRQPRAHTRVVRHAPNSSTIGKAPASSATPAGSRGGAAARPGARVSASRARPKHANETCEQACPGAASRLRNGDCDTAVCRAARPRSELAAHCQAEVRPPPRPAPAPGWPQPGPCCPAASMFRAVSHTSLARVNARAHTSCMRTPSPHYTRHAPKAVRRRGAVGRLPPTTRQLASLLARAAHFVRWDDRICRMSAHARMAASRRRTRQPSWRQQADVGARCATARARGGRRRRGCGIGRRALGRHSGALLRLLLLLGSCPTI